MVSAEGADLASLMVSQKNTVFFRVKGDSSKRLTESTGPDGEAIIHITDIRFFSNCFQVNIKQHISKSFMITQSTPRITVDLFFKQKALIPRI